MVTNTQMLMPIHALASPLILKTANMMNWRPAMTKKAMRSRSVYSGVRINDPRGAIKTTTGTDAAQQRYTREEIGSLPKPRCLRKVVTMQSVAMTMMADAVRVCSLIAKREPTAGL